MKTRISLISLIVLYVCSSLYAQEPDLFYYYKGAPVPLSTNTQHFIVYADAEKISKEFFAKEYRVTEWIEDGRKGVLEAQVNIPNANYDSVINILRGKEYTIDIEPVIETSAMVNVSNLFYVKLRSSNDYALLKSVASISGTEIKGKVDFCDNWYELCVTKNSAGNSIEVANLFWETGYFEDIDPGFILHFELTSVTGCVADSRFEEQWGMHAIKVCSAWKITTGDTNVRVAVVDKGIYTDHREFDNTSVAFSYDMDTHTQSANTYCKEELDRDTPDPNPDPPFCFYHGTHVGGIIFANHNRDSIAGVCPNAGLINISYSFTLEKDTGARRLAQAINLSVLNNARIINNSWMVTKDSISPLTSAILENSLDDALENDCVVVFAAGNQSHNSVNYPACYSPRLLAVGGIDANYNTASCSNYGSGLDVVAPAINILSTNDNDGYYSAHGTSMAAPHVSGVAGLMLSINPDLTGQEVRDIIEQTAQKLPGYDFDSAGVNGTWNPYMGYGLLDAHRAVLKAAYHKVYGDTALAICDTSVRAYTVRAPHNANIDSVSFFWTCTDNLQMAAGISIGNEKLEIRNYGKC